MEMNCVHDSLPATRPSPEAEVKSPLSDSVSLIIPSHLSLHFPTGFLNKICPLCHTQDKQQPQFLKTEGVTDLSNVVVVVVVVVTG
jgi:hypothetical protein